MSSFCLLVTSPPFETDVVNTVTKFAKAAISSGHQVTKIFFFAKGVNNAASSFVIPTDEYQLMCAWRELSDMGIELHVCISAANRRGLATEQDKNDNQLPGFNLTAPFEATGLGQLVVELESADRVVQF